MTGAAFAIVILAALLFTPNYPERNAKKLSKMEIELQAQKELIFEDSIGQEAYDKSIEKLELKIDNYKKKMSIKDWEAYDKLELGEQSE